MCGLFGMIRAVDAPVLPASKMLIALGHLAQDRGRHASGLAFGPRYWGEPVAAIPGDLRERDAWLGGWRVVKRTGPFAALWRTGPAEALASAAVVLGHDRYATQGRIGDLANTSPLAVGNVLGTHAGDVDADDAAGRFMIDSRVGQTDSEVLLSALEQAGGKIEGTRAVLEGVLGRAAVVWIDQRWPGLVMAARTAVTTLAFARDEHGGLYWATNPMWLRSAAKHAGLRLARLWMVPEGTLMFIDVADGPVLADRVQFTATVRTSDEGWGRAFAHRGFALRDVERDLSVRRHRVLDPLTLV